MCISCIHICYGFVLCIFRNIYKIVLSVTLYKYVIFGLGNIEDALQKIKRFVCSKSAFFEAFIEEGLKFTSSLYLMLIWIRVLRFVLENPEEVNKQMVNVPYFGEFHKMPTTENYMDGLVRSMCKLQIAPRPETPRVKRRLIELQDSETEEEPAVAKKKRKSKKKKSARE